MSARQARAVMAVLILLHVAGAVFFVPFGWEPGDSLWDKALFASLSSVLPPSALLAFWAVFGPPCLAIRLPATVLLAAAHCLALAYGQMCLSRDNSHQTIAVALACMGVFAAMQLPLWLVRWLRGWRLRRSADSATSPAPSVEDGKGAVPVGGNQYTIRLLFAWTTTSAVILAALCRLLPLSDYSAEDWSGIVGDSCEIGLYFCATCLPIFFVAWAVLTVGPRPVFRSLMILISLALAPAAFLLGGYLESSERAVEMALITSGVLADGLVTWIVLRACGYRLVRPPADDRIAGVPALVGDRGRRLAWGFALAPLIAWTALTAWRVPLRMAEWHDADQTYYWAERGFQFFQLEGHCVLRHDGHVQLADETMREIGEFKGLTMLHLSAPVGERQLALLPRLPALVSLSIANTDIGDTGLALLDRFPSLSGLGLQNTAVTDKGLNLLARLPHLTLLNLQMTDITDQSVTALSRLKHLKTLDLGLTEVTPAAVQRLQAALRGTTIISGASDYFLLQSKGERATLMTESTTTYLYQQVVYAPLRSKRLTAKGRLVTDAGLVQIGELEEIERLDLRDSVITDAGLPWLVELVNLRFLDLRGTRISEKAIARLQPRLPKCVIVRPSSASAPPAGNVKR